MRIVYDDEKRDLLVDEVDSFFGAYVYGQKRIGLWLDIFKQLDGSLRANWDLEIGEDVVHAHGIGNNCRYPVYYHHRIDGECKELQQVGYININHGMYGEVFVYVGDYNNQRLSYLFEVSECRPVKKTL